MSRVNIIQAWKSAEYRASPTEAERAQLPDHPAGLNELMNTQLEHVVPSVLTLEVSPTVATGFRT